MKKKLLLLALALACLSCLFAVTVSATDDTPTLSVNYTNLSFKDSVYIKYAVAAENVAPEDVRLLVFTEPQDDYTDESKATVLMPKYLDTVNGAEHIIFDYTNLAARQMTDEVYACAMVKVGNKTYYSNIKKYSILQYATSAINNPSAKQSLKNMLAGMLDYGALAQTHFEYKADRPANASWVNITVESGTHTDGFTTGMFITGDTVTLTPAEAPAGKVFSHWVNAAGERQTMPITAPAQNETYTAVYKGEVTYSQGLDIEEDERAGAGYVLGLGTCEDTEIVIPPMTDGGYPVTEIDRYAFENKTTITSVSLPNTITVIGRYAFDGCTSLTDVYYDGTEEEWAQNVEIESGNDAIENATMHFHEAPVETFTVTFVDHDGTLLKTETVESGKSATAPADPEREGFTFTGWDKAFDNVTADLTVTAQYVYAASEPTFFVSSATAAAGDTVAVTVQVLNNPGVTSMLMKIAFDDDALDLVSMTYNSEIGGMVVEPQFPTSPITAYWAHGTKNVTGDWIFVTLEFNVSSTAAVGDYDITLTYDPKDVYNVDDVDVDFNIVNGRITVS